MKSLTKSLRPLAVLVGVWFVPLGGNASDRYLGRTLHVPDDYAQIQAAIDAANEGDVVLVQPGTYVETLDFLGKGITVTGTAPEDSAVVASTVVDAPSTEHDPLSVVTFRSGEDSTSVLAGLTLTGGDGTKKGGSGNSTVGGGVYCEGSDPKLSHCLIVENRVHGARDWGRGGGLYCESASPTLVSCTITGNSASHSAGGVCCNKASPALTNCTISGNSAPGHGGGLWCYSSPSSPTLTNCTITGNSTSGQGGGLCCYPWTSATLTNCTISGNSAQFGGGFCCHYPATSVALTNCTITGNSAYVGGGVRCSNTASPKLTNCTITGNWAERPYGGGGVYCDVYASPTLTNCILRANTPGELGGPASPIVTYSDIDGGWEGEGNIDANPKFRTFRGFDYILAPHSPCIDAGDPAILDGISDWHPRWPNWYPNGSRSDMGAYGGPGNWRWLVYEPPGFEGLEYLARRTR